jgi:hypothetical protein
MSPPRSTYGRALNDLVTNLGRYSALDIEPTQRAFAVFVEIATTPLMWPLDDVLYELLLSTAGFDLTTAEHLHAALWATALLVAGDPSYEGLYCGHGETPSSLCALNTDTDLDGQYCAVMDLAHDGEFDHLYELRKIRCAHYGVEGLGGDEIPDAA